MKINTLELKQYRGFREATLEFSPGVNLLAGPNGSGKSSVLDAVFSFFLCFAEGFLPDLSSPRTGMDTDDIMISCDKVYCSLTLEIEGEKFSPYFTTWRQPSMKRQKNDWGVDYRQKISSMVENIEKNPSNSIPTLAFYSSNRFVEKIHSLNNNRINFERSTIYRELFSKFGIQNDFTHFFTWFKNREDLENETLRRKASASNSGDWEYPDRQLDAVRRAITTLLPEFSELQIRRNPLSMVVNKQGREFRIDQLSDGEKGLIAMIGDIARRLAMANPGRENPLEGSGVVLIDEIELHLHPGWQRLVVNRLSEIFPNCQFILTTHSPQVLSEVDPDSVYLFWQDSEQGEIHYSRPDKTYGLDAAEVLEMVMGTDSRNVEVNKRLQEIYELIDTERYAEAKEQIAALGAKTHGSIPEAVRAATMIEMLEEPEA